MFQSRELSEYQTNYYLHRTGLALSERTKQKIEEFKRNKLSNKAQNHAQQDDIPDEFDARTNWPDCPSIREIFVSL